jgi:hypothetical protein
MDFKPQAITSALHASFQTAHNYGLISGLGSREQLPTSVTSIRSMRPTMPRRPLSLLLSRRPRSSLQVVFADYFKTQLAKIRSSRILQLLSRTQTVLRLVRSPETQSCAATLQPQSVVNNEHGAKRIEGSMK